jgi:transglutaminase-like putative cysteine protease
MTEFLQPTLVIDCHHPQIIAAAREIAGDASNDEQVARRLFLWVRDQVRHSSDCQIPTVTCAASEVLQHRVGFCFAKGHLLAALLRARAIPAALCYQRLLLNSDGHTYCLHGMVSVHLRRHGWYRIDPRGNRPGIETDFSPPVERLAFTPRHPGELDVPGRYPDALPNVVSVLQKCATADEVVRNLPDIPPPAS